MGKKIDENEFWHIEKCILSKSGIFPYLGKEISPDLEPDKIYNVYRPEEELLNEKTINSFKLLPFVNEHTMLGKDYTPPEDKGVDGVTGNNIFSEGQKVYGDLKIFSETMKDDIDSGKKGLSMGFFCNYEIVSGEFEGQKYDAIQRNIVGNHIALVDEGRVGPDAKVLDRKITFDSIEELSKMVKKKGKEVLNCALDSKGAMDNTKVVDNILEIAGGEKTEEEKKEALLEIVEALVDFEEKEDPEKVEDNEEDPEKGKDNEPDKKAQDEEDPKAEKKTEPKEKTGTEDKAISLDKKIAEALAERDERDELVEKVSSIVGTFDHKKMSLNDVVKYSCDKLSIKSEKGQEKAALHGYLQALGNAKNVSYVMDNDVAASNNEEDEAFENYISEEK